MAPLRTWYLKVLLCVTAFLSLIVLWCQLSQLPGTVEGVWSWVFPMSTSREKGIDFSSLFTHDLDEPLCQTGQVLLVLVTSHPEHHEPRKAIRKTWAVPDNGAAHPWQVIFLIGQTSDVEQDWRIHSEQNIHGDILMGNYLDTYHNLTLKVMHGIKWATDKCRPQYILKTDDDCFVNTNLIPVFLGKYNMVKTGLYVGSSFSQDKRLVIRDPSSKWYVSQQEYDLDVYPPYASGIGYILSLDVARLVLRMATAVPIVPMEDAYVGILAKKAGITLLSSSRFAKHNIKWSICNYRYLMVIHRLSPKDQAVAQGNVQRARTACMGNRVVTLWS
ncbi:beta-1,3-galactosyltransferase 5-like [Bombina bombina]|uniref:beta-1,3-galactosyltransferase 5-like n=1 Tax=Bombina bombina TaxID=8345 RepID=UPI00235A7096|nr:beta-1,3-galactosyltransferase 5-like [Bombina bombina]